MREDERDIFTATSKRRSEGMNQCGEKTKCQLFLKIWEKATLKLNVDSSFSEHEAARSIFTSRTLSRSTFHGRTLLG